MSQLQKFTNNASATLNGGITGSATTIVLGSGQGNLFPALSGALFFIGTLKSVSSGLLEIVKVIARVGDTLTVIRGQEGTSGAAFIAGDVFELRPTAQAFDNIYIASAQLDGAAFTGTVTVPTVASADNSTNAASTAYVKSQNYAPTASPTFTGTSTFSGPVVFNGGLTTSSINGGQIAGQRNKVINGAFNVNQRVVSGTVTLAAGVYGHDCWKAGASGVTYTFATSANVTTITITAGSLIQVVEGINLQTGTYSLSWTGTSQGKIGAGAFSASGVTGAITGGVNTNIEFNTGTVTFAQFEFGTRATLFEQRIFQAELAMCMRYYETSYPYGTAPGTALVSNMGALSCATQSGVIGAANLTFIFKVPKGGSPTMQCYNPISGAVAQMRDGASGASGVTFNTLTNALFSATCFNSGAALSANSIASSHFTAEWAL